MPVSTIGVILVCGWEKDLIFTDAGLIIEIVAERVSEGGKLWGGEEDITVDAIVVGWE